MNLAANIERRPLPSFIAYHGLACHILEQVIQRIKRTHLAEVIQKYKIISMTVLVRSVREFSIISISCMAYDICVKVMQAIRYSHNN